MAVGRATSPQSKLPKLTTPVQGPFFNPGTAALQNQMTLRESAIVTGQSSIKAHVGVLATLLICLSGIAAVFC